MNVKLACQTLSSSVAESIEFMMHSGHAEFQNAEGTVEFIQVLHKLFDFDDLYCMAISIRRYP